MRILYDGAIYQEPLGGINRYFANVIGRLPETFTPHLTTCRPSSQNDPAHPHLQVHRFKRFRPRRVSLKFERAYFGRIAKSQSFDLAHPTYYTLLSQREIAEYRCPVVITVWDMIHELFPEMDPFGRVAGQKRRAVEVADAVICISENTKKDLLERYPAAECKVTVTHLAANLEAGFYAGQPQGSGPIPATPYFIYVGARHGYKNFAGLQNAFAKVAAAEPQVSLCIVGPPFSQAEGGRLAELGLTNRVAHYGQVTDAHLASLYRNSVALVYPSFYEGFGIPLLEAMSCGTAVVASNRSSIPEVVGDAALLFDPSREEELTNILVTLPRDTAQRDSLIHKGYLRAQQFSWDTTANQTIAVYNRVAQVGSRPATAPFPPLRAKRD